MPNVHPKKMKSWEDLRRQITPSIPAEGGERIPWQWFHRRTFTDNSTTSLRFFDETGGVTTTNMQAAGQIPAPMYFDIYHIGVYFDLTTSIQAIVAGAVNDGALEDMINLMDGVVHLEVAQKRYWESFIWACPAGGGVDGDLAMAGTYTATDGDRSEFATNGVPDLRNRQCLWGDITIPHNQNFSVELRWPAAVDTQVGNVDIITYLEGYLYRRVL